ncbi:MAG: zinc-dependent metalloprotease family protein [Phycisphaerales bacterium]
MKAITCLPLAMVLLLPTWALAQENRIFASPPVNTPPLAAAELVLRARTATPDFKRLSLFRDARAGELAFNLFDDLSLTGEVRRVESLGSAEYTLSGVIPRTLGGNFTISVVDNSIWADIQVPGKVAARVRMLPNGACAIEQMDDPRIVSCSGGIVPGPNSPDGDAGRVGGFEERSACPEPDGRFDIAVFWTPAAETAAGGESAIRSVINAAVTRANDAYANSGVSTRMRLVYAARTEYTEAADMTTDLNRLTNCCDGFMDEVHPRRNAFGADFVHVVTNTGSGIAWLYTPGDPAFSGKAFSVGKWDRISTTWTLAHEVGHNMGCNHNLADAGNPPVGWFPYSLGWFWTGNSGTQWGSVMSYVGTRVAQFSNPDVNFDGQPTGNRNNFGVLIAANAQTLNFTDQASANWRNPVYAQKAYSGIETGCEATPWNTLSEALNTVDSGGAVIMKAGSGMETGTFSTACTIRAEGGNATIGR